MMNTSLLLGKVLAVTEAGGLTTPTGTVLGAQTNGTGISSALVWAVVIFGAVALTGFIFFIVRKNRNEQ